MTESAPEFENWNERVRHAQEMIPLIYQLHRKNNVVTSIFGRLLVGVTWAQLKPCQSCASSWT